MAGSSNHGQRGQLPPTFRMVARHHFLFSGLYFFFKMPDVKKNEAIEPRKEQNVCAPATSSII